MARDVAALTPSDRQAFLAALSLDQLRTLLDEATKLVCSEPDAIPVNVYAEIQQSTHQRLRAQIVQGADVVHLGSLAARPTILRRTPYTVRLRRELTPAAPIPCGRCSRAPRRTRRVAIRRARAPGRPSDDPPLASRVAGAAT